MHGSNRRQSVVILSTLVAAVWVAAANAPQLFSQEPAQLMLAFRLPQWKASHVDDAAKAEKFASDLKRIGCEVKTNSHNGHTDVMYRMADWSPMAVADDDQAHQWLTWLESNGFEALHGYKANDSAHQHQHVDGQPHREVVTYRLADWKSRHAHKAGEDKVMKTVFTALGCEVEIGKHGDHADVRYRCVEWMSVELLSHDAAHQWQTFLNQAGFETQHSH
jgi:hypothetical protein